TRVLKRRSVQERTRSERTSSCTLSKYGLLNTRRFPLPSKIGAEKSLVRFYTHQPNNVKYTVDYFRVTHSPLTETLSSPRCPAARALAAGFHLFVPMIILTDCR
ncbi:hypothetical protein, partial [Cloacibacillus porcorum]